MTKTERTCVSNIHVAKQEVMKGKYDKIILTKNGKESMVLMSINCLRDILIERDYLQNELNKAEEKISDLLCGRII